MLSRRVLGATRLVRLYRQPLLSFPRPILSASQYVRTYADKVVKVPQMAESISEGTLKQWSKQIGDFVEQDEEIATIETDKIDVAVNAPEAGTIKEFLANEEDTVTVGQDLVRIELGDSPSGSADKPSTAESKEAGESSSKDESSSKEESASKQNAAAEKSMSEQSSTPEPNPQSKPRENKTPGTEKKDTTASKPPKEAGAGGSGLGDREEHRVKMNRMRLRIAERLKQSQNTAASLTTFAKVDMSSWMEFRNQNKDDVLKKTGIKLGFMGAFARACVLAMREFPSVNASIEGSDGGDTIVYRDYVDISVAVATEKGLVTPIVRNAQAMDVIGIEKSIAELGKKARDGKLTIEDMAGGTFTISNGGVFGSLLSTPIINLPQSAVLGLHAINDDAVVVKGQIVIRPIMFIALTYDHRLLDGREAVLFLRKVKESIEDPRRMLL